MAVTNYQYQRPPVPANATPAEKRMYQGLFDIFDNLYAMMGRLDEKKLSSGVRAKLDNIGTLEESLNTAYEELQGAIEAGGETASSALLLYFNNLNQTIVDYATATLANANAALAVQVQNFQTALSSALSSAMDQVSSARADLDAYKSEVKEFIDWQAGTGLRLTFPGSPITQELSSDGNRIKYEGVTVNAQTAYGDHTPRLVVEDKASFGNPTDGYIQFIHTTRGLAIKAGDTI